MTGMEEMYRVRWKFLFCNLGMIPSLAIGRRGILGLVFFEAGTHKETECEQKLAKPRERNNIQAKKTTCVKTPGWERALVDLKN